MKKTLLLSVVASTMIMAGGDIAPVEPVVEAPAAASAWEFSGNAVVYYQTADQWYGDYSLFDQEASAADAGIQLRATNNDVVAGIGAGFAVNGLSTLNLENSVVNGVMQLTGNPVAGNDIDDVTDGGWISEAYLTYGFGNTSIKAGRQTLPKSLSPFAYSENWNVFANTFDSVLVVNTDIENTTIVGAWVYGGNVNSFGMTNLTDFNALNDDDGVYMLTLQNKSIADLTLTGSYYYGSEHIGGEDTQILWGDAAYDAGSFGLGIQGGTLMNDSFVDDMTAFGAKITTEVSGFNLMAAYSDVQDGAMLQLGGTTSALYTNTVANELVNGLLEIDASKILVGAGVDALGGNFNAAYAMTDSDVTGDVNEFDLVYSTNLTDALGLTAAYVNIDADAMTDSLNVVRLIANYNF
ncbi:hypothetical protein MN086_09825 [Sulfurovum sp. XGS-02]|uniref:hypothetical protein n=1 Tax=Sulfurovum sp. XGS-02 TaxID=2925411 RepID=UPI002060440B|nr:hypothetical protein [Sulfurovum sp. XGS-02]UPT77340.1 hypothetical protein MN086_09825 [Sulfurovum sp. XGS-02]